MRKDGEGLVGDVKTSTTVSTRLILMVNESVIDILLLRAELALTRQDIAQTEHHCECALQIAFELERIDSIRSCALTVRIHWLHVMALHAYGNVEAAKGILDVAAEINALVPEDCKIIPTQIIADGQQDIMAELAQGAKRKAKDQLCGSLVTEARSSVLSQSETPVGMPSAGPFAHVILGGRYRTPSNASSIHNMEPLNLEMGDFTPITPSHDTYTTPGWERVSYFSGASSLRERDDAGSASSLSRSTSLRKRKDTSSASTFRRPISLLGRGAPHPNPQSQERPALQRSATTSSHMEHTGLLSRSESTGSPLNPVRERK